MLESWARCYSANCGLTAADMERKRLRGFQDLFQDATARITKARIDCAKLMSSRFAQSSKAALRTYRLESGEVDGTLWRPAPAVPAWFVRAPSSVVRIHDPGIRRGVRVRRHVGRCIRRWRDDDGRRRRDNHRRRISRIIRCVRINDLRVCTGYSDQRECRDQSGQHPHHSASS
jgi:hypothetical protein